MYSKAIGTKGNAKKPTNDVKHAEVTCDANQEKLKTTGLALGGNQ